MTKDNLTPSDLPLAVIVEPPADAARPTEPDPPSSAVEPPPPKAAGWPIVKGFIGGLVGGLAVAALAVVAVIVAWPNLQSLVFGSEDQRLSTVERALADVNPRLAAVEREQSRSAGTETTATVQALAQRVTALEAQTKTPIADQNDRSAADIARLEAEIQSLRRAMPPEGTVLRLAERAEFGGKGSARPGLPERLGPGPAARRRTVARRGRSRRPVPERTAGGPTGGDAGRRSGHRGHDPDGRRRGAPPRRVGRRLPRPVRRYPARRRPARRERVLATSALPFDVAGQHPAPGWTGRRPARRRRPGRTEDQGGRSGQGRPGSVGLAGPAARARHAMDFRPLRPAWRSTAPCRSCRRRPPPRRRKAAANSR